MGLSLRDRWLTALAYPHAQFDALPPAPLDPTRLTEMLDRADRHGVLPATLANLQAAAADEGAARVIYAGKQHSPQALEDALRPAEKRLLFRSAQALKLRWLTRQTSAALTSAGVPNLVLKGCEFADRLYDPPSLRTFTDVDLLVPFTALQAAIPVMHRLGYEPRDPESSRRPDYAECAWRHPVHKSLVEIHWDVAHSPSLRQGISLTYEDLRLEQPGRVSDASLLLIAAVHAAASHGFDRLGPLCDVALAARGVKDNEDLVWLRDRTESPGRGLAVMAALRLSGELFPEPACAKLLERLKLPARGFWRYCVSPGMVLRLHAKRDSFRRQGFRQMLKRK
jgi:hypothetical protein